MTKYYTKTPKPKHLYQGVIKFTTLVREVLLLSTIVKVPDLDPGEEKKFIYVHFVSSS